MSRRLRREARLGLKVCGRTPDGLPVLRGVFKLVNERGVPMDLVLSFLQEHGYAMDWEHFVTEALKTGWTVKGLYTRVEDSLTDAVGPEQREEIMHRLRALLMKKIEEEQHGNS